MRFIITTLVLFSYFFCSAQSTTEKLYTIKTKDKKEIIGTLKKITPDSIIIQNHLMGVLRYSRDQISSFQTRTIPPLFRNNSEPYFFQTGIPNGKGNHYYRNYAIFGNYLSLGLNDNFDASFGFETVSLLGGPRVPVFHAGAKFSEQINDYIHVGLSIKTYFNDEGYATVYNLPVTFGGQRTNFTITPGIAGASDSDFLFLPAFNFNLALSKRLRFVVDGVYIEDYLIGTLLLEITTNKNFNLLLGAIYLGDSFVLPNLALTLPFGSANRRS